MEASGGKGLVRGIHPGTREVSPSRPIIILHHVMPKDGNHVAIEAYEVDLVKSRGVT